VSKRVLIVEDDPNQRAAYAALLCYTGYVVDEVGSATDCVTYLGERTPDVILLEVVLPDTNALHVLPSIKAIAGSEEMRIVCMTASDVSPARVKAAGCDGFLQKPFDGAALVRALEVAFGENTAGPG